MVGPCVAVDDDNINVPDGKNSLHIAQEHIHHLLKYGGTRGKAEG